MTAAIDIIANNGTVGGGEVMMVALAEAVRAADVTVRVVAPAGPGDAAQLAEEHGLDVLRIRSHDRPSYLENLARSRTRLDSELWWCNGLVPALATAGSRHRRVVHLHQAPNLVQRRVWQVARRGVEAVFVPSRSMQVPIPDSRVLLNWTDDPGTPIDPKPATRPGVRIGFIGRFSTIKGLDVLARAMHQLEGTSTTPIRLVLAGDGRFVPREMLDVVELELGRVRDVERLGWVTREEFFSDVDLVVVPSVWSEPFGLVAAEAMAFGRPILVSDAGALGEIVGPSHPWVARAGDPVDTARGIQRFLDSDPALRAEVVSRARRRWESEFSPAAGARRVAEALTSLGLRGPVASSAKALR